MYTVELPFRLASITVSMLWHPRMHADPVHAWLRERLRETVAAADGRSRRV
jgi:DNA-binding transcriptional LysR family regulator